MNSNAKTGAVATGVALAAAPPGSGGVACSAHAETGCDAACQEDLGRARAATERSQDVTAATAEGMRS